jgi:nucleotide-binding universal stress UspA family protein
MKRSPMKVMIAYDGSKYADAAIDDLSKAGFPGDSEVLITSVADFSDRRPTASEFDLISAASRRVDAVLEQARNHEARVLRETRVMGSKVVHKLRREFPEWKVYSEVLRGAPAEVLLKKAAEWQPEMIMGGSQGRSAVGRFLLGSVSKSVAEQASMTVRVVRRGSAKTASDPLELIVGAKHPAEVERIVEHLKGRIWPADTRIRLVAITDRTPGKSLAFYADGRSVLEHAAEQFGAGGARVSVQIESGEPATILLDAANVWRAAAIYVVANSSGEQQLDEVASSLVTTAKCTVEIIR